MPQKVHPSTILLTVPATHSKLNNACKLSHISTFSLQSTLKVVKACVSGLYSHVCVSLVITWWTQNWEFILGM